MKKKYLFSLPIVSSLATLPFFISQSNSANQNTTDSNSILEKIKNEVAKSILDKYNLSFKTLTDTTIILGQIKNNYGIDVKKIGAEYLYVYINKLNELTTVFNNAYKSGDYQKLITNNNDYISAYSDLASEYFAAQHLEELLRTADKKLRDNLISQASVIYDNAKSKYKAINKGNPGALYPPVKLIANAYDEAAVKYLGEELTKAKKINEENQNKIK
ncbi:hypothetical protein, partial [Mycoplasmopsis meleagridis]|uniref:hypothetical protein n=1 Tax=Mycoplasmopsis meleagridis TaxID=29561 RepID=UPI00137B66F3